MPIRPENRGRYPKDWKAISARIKRRARNRCEFTVDDGVTTPRRCKARHGKPHPVTGAIVVLTVAHLNHLPEDCRDENLKAACQRCHNRYDAPMRARGIKARARDKRAAGDLFGASP
jgi:5-methylcytosine-specific restriction endonuclease McrA